MGYRRNRKIYRLTFEEYDGLEIMARSVPIGELLDVMQMLSEMGKQPSRAQMEKLFGLFAAQIVSWNYEDEDGEPLPATLGTLLAEDDFGFVIKLINGWVGAIAGQPDPTTAGTDTARMEASIPVTPSPGS